MFPITITITIHNVDQLNAVSAALSTTTNPAKAAVANAIKAGIPPKVEDPKVETNKDEEKPEALTQMNAKEAEAALDNVASKPAAPTYGATAAAITKVSREKGRDAAVAVLKKFGAEKLPAVKPEQFAEVIAECDKVLGV